MSERAGPSVERAVRGHPGGGARLLAATREGVVCGTFVIEVPAPRTLTILAVAGFDFVVVDLEHSPLGLGGLESLVAGAAALRMPMLVRVWAPDTGLIGKVLDIGASGIVVPHVGSAEEAQQAVTAARYPPLGERSVVPLTCFADSAKSLAERDAETVLVLQLEGPSAIENCEAIAATPGVSAIFIGVYDLAASLGSDVTINGREVEAAAHSVADRVGAQTPLGIYVDDPADSQQWGRRGFHLQCVSFDGAMLRSGAQRVLRLASDRTGAAGRISVPATSPGPEGRQP